MKSNIWSLTVAPSNGQMTVNIETYGNDPVMMHGDPVVMKGIVDAIVYGITVGEINGENEDDDQEYMQ